MENPNAEEAWEFWRSIGSPTKIVAPMVDQSELAFRMLCRRYGAELCYTPMINSKVFVEDKKYRKVAISELIPEDRPILVQICGHDPQKMLEAALQLQPYCDGIDINLGCPQGIAKKGYYGAFLLEDFDLLRDIVSTLTQELSVPVTCKIRKLPRLEDTLHLCDVLVGAGAKMLCVHGRLKECKGEVVGAADWEVVKQIKQHVNVPVVLNGGIATYEDYLRALDETGVDGVMSSEAILENPGLFNQNISKLTGQLADQYDYMTEYIELQKLYPNSVHHVRGHIFKLLYSKLYIQENLDQRDRLTKALTPECYDIVREMIRRRDPEYHHPETPYQLEWYYRHRKKLIGLQPDETPKEDPIVELECLEDGTLAGMFLQEDEW
mmetsp:Transcript_25758/g.33764  ORF Transcript_25758/g.33764 Transcript_25758/m.33764 type:complete len:380 (+) Transcript_25758:56-1195(+)